MNKLLIVLALLFSMTANADIISQKFFPCNKANGVACTDGSNKIPVAQLPAATMVYKGVWAPGGTVSSPTQSPTLSDAGCVSAVNGNVYRVSANLGIPSAPITGWGSTFTDSSMNVLYIGDSIICNSDLGLWQKAPASDGVTEVNGYTGNVNLTKSDIGLSAVTNDAQVKSVSGTAPVVSSGGTTPAISMHVADSSHDGYLSQGDWSTFNGKQAALGFTAVPDSRTVNGHALTSNVTVTTTDLSLNNLTNDAQVKVSDYSAKSTILIGTGASSFAAVATAGSGDNGKVLMADSTQSSGWKVGSVPAALQNLHQDISLSSGNISAGYVDLSQQCSSNPLLRVGAVWGTLGSDYTLSVVSTKTRVTFVTTTGWGSGSPQALDNTDTLSVDCQY